MFVIPFPAPATSHAACGFPALRVPAHFISRFMRLIMLAPLSATAGIAIGDATAANRSLGAIKRQDVSVFALTYSLRRRSCRSIGAFIISPLPPMLTKIVSSSTDFPVLPVCEDGFSSCLAGPFAPPALPGFITTTNLAATVSSSTDFPVLPVIRPTLLHQFLDGTRTASPVA